MTTSTLIMNIAYILLWVVSIFVFWKRIIEHPVKFFAFLVSFVVLELIFLILIWFMFFTYSPWNSVWLIEAIILSIAFIVYSCVYFKLKVKIMNTVSKNKFIIYWFFLPTLIVTVVLFVNFYLNPVSTIV
jgi:hypothetical protein